MEDLSDHQEYCSPCVASVPNDGGNPYGPFNNGDRRIDTKELLTSLGVRPTKQRLALAELLRGQGNRHLTAEMLFEEALKMREPPSLATVYNTLSLFTEAGLLQPVSIDGSKTYYDTNVTAHQHFYAEDRHELLDISDSCILIDNLPAAPEGYEISRVDLVIRIRRKRASQVPL